MIFFKGSLPKGLIKVIPMLNYLQAWDYIHQITPFIGSFQCINHSFLACPIMSLQVLPSLKLLLAAAK